MNAESKVTTSTICLVVHEDETNVFVYQRDALKRILICQFNTTFAVNDVDDHELVLMVQFLLLIIGVVHKFH